MAGLFDTYKSPDEVKRDIRTEGIAQDRSAPTGWGAISSAAAGGGRMLAQGLGGEDPRVGQARKMQSIMNEMAMSGLQPNTPEFNYKASELLMAGGFQKEAFNAAQQGKELERKLEKEAYTKEGTELSRKKTRLEIEGMEATTIPKKSRFKGVLNGKQVVGFSDENGNIFANVDGRLIKNPAGLTEVVTGTTEHDPKLGKKATNELEKAVISGQATMTTLDNVADTYKKDYMGYLAQLKGGAYKIAAKAGITLSKEAKQFLAGKTRFRTGVQQFFNQYRKEITGAAAALKELELLKQSMFNEDMSDVEFEAAYDQFRNSAQAMLELKQQLLTKGIPEKEIYKRLDAGEWVTLLPKQAAEAGALNTTGDTGTTDLSQVSDEQLLEMMNK